MRKWYVLAWPDPTATYPGSFEPLNGGAQDSRIATLKNQILNENDSQTLTPPPPGTPLTVYEGIPYNSIDDLIAQLGTKITGDDVLFTLEVVSHGTPTSCGGITAANASEVGKKFMLLSAWGETCFIYLSGCNTGMVEHGGDKSIARLLADAMPWTCGPPATPPLTMHKQLTVSGLNGYGSQWGGSLTNLNIKQLRTEPEVNWNGDHYGPKDSPKDYKGPKSPSEKGECWISNQNDIDTGDKWSCK